MGEFSGYGIYADEAYNNNNNNNNNCQSNIGTKIDMFLITKQM